MAESRETGGGRKPLVSRRELEALLRDPEDRPSSVLLVSPFGADREELGLVLQENDRRLLACSRASEALSVAERRPAAVVLASEVLAAEPGSVEALRASWPGVPVYVLADELESINLRLEPPSGVWLRSEAPRLLSALLKDEASLLEEEGRGASEVSEIQASLEELLARGIDAAAYTTSEEGFFMLVCRWREPWAEAALGWLLRNALSACRHEAPKRLDTAFGVVEVRESPSGGKVLLFTFKEEAKAVGTASGGSVPRSGSVLPFESFLNELGSPLSDLTYVAVAAPLTKTKLEALLKRGAFAAREPSGAWVLAVVLEEDTDPQRFFQELFGGEPAVLWAPLARIDDPGAWISRQSGRLADLRLAGVKGCFSLNR